MDYAALVTKDDTDLWFTAEIIVNGEIVHSAQYATRASAFKDIAFHVIEEHKKKEETTNE